MHISSECIRLLFSHFSVHWLKHHERRAKLLWFATKFAMNLSEWREGRVISWEWILTTFMVPEKLFFARTLPVIENPRNYRVGCWSKRHWQRTELNGPMAQNEYLQTERLVGCLRHIFLALMQGGWIALKHSAAGMTLGIHALSKKKKKKRMSEILQLGKAKLASSSADLTV